MSEDNTFKSLAFDDAARNRLVDGVNILANAVKVTMGPKGQNVVIEKPGMIPHLTKDGVSVAKSINIRDKFRNLGVQMVKEAASQTADTAGDGTTTATVLAQAIFTEGMKMIAAGHPSAEIQKGICEGVDIVLEELKSMAVPVSNINELIHVGTISANGDRSIGELLADAMGHVGKDGIITVEEAKGFSTTLDVVEGLELDRGYLSPYFITDQDKMASVLENPCILLINKKLNTLQEIIHVLEQCNRTKRPLLIVADDIEGEALQGLVVNKMKGTLDVCAIRAPEFGEARVNALDDLGIMFGCRPLTSLDSSSLENISLDDLGSCKKVIIYKHRAIFVGSSGGEEAREARLGEVKSLLGDPTLQGPDRMAVGRRIQRLASGIAVLRVGAPTEIELRERKDRVDDALNATQAAVEEGILPGGGISLVKASSILVKKVKRMPMNAHRVGMEIVAHACTAPLQQIVKNSGESSEIIVQKALKARYNNLGYNAATGEWIDMFEGGIIDPHKVVRTALQNASSSARMLLSVGCAVVEDDDDFKDTASSVIFS